MKEAILNINTKLFGTDPRTKLRGRGHPSLPCAHSIGAPALLASMAIKQ